MTPTDNRHPSPSRMLVVCASFAIVVALPACGSATADGGSRDSSSSEASNEADRGPAVTETIHPSLLTTTTTRTPPHPTAATTVATTAPTTAATTVATTTTSNPPPPAAIPADVLFAEDSAELDAGAGSVLAAVLAEMLANPQVGLVIGGHTDSLGSVEFNDSLSRDRAEAIKEWFVDHGIAPDRLTTEGRGEDEPVASNDTPEGRAKNRRVQLTFVW